VILAPPPKDLTYTLYIAAKGRSLNAEHSGSPSAAVSAHFEHSLRMEIFESSKRNLKALDRRLVNFRRN
jgi:hypothetical protein